MSEAFENEHPKALESASSSPALAHVSQLSSPLPAHNDETSVPAYPQSVDDTSKTVVQSRSSLDSAMSPSHTHPRHGQSRISMDSVGPLEGGEDANPAWSSPTRRRSSGRLVAFIDKLKPSRHGGGGSIGDSSDLHCSNHNHEAKSARSSRMHSGKHTPTCSEPSGDFGEFLKAAELRERLEREQWKEAERELKLAKQRKRGSTSNVTQSVSKPASPDETFSPADPLEKTKQFPGGFEERATDRLSKPTTPRKHLSRSSSRSKPSFNVCGVVDVSSDEDIDPEDAEKTLLDDGFADHSGRSSPMTSASRPAPLPRSASGSSLSTSGSLAGDLPHDVPLRHPDKNASTVSLKSWRSSDSPGTHSIASGGANAKLSAPLLELEELELQSFLRNFNRHTREVRVPASVHFPRRRMPKWEDFRVPPGEAALAAQEGKRVTVLTHVDRGLQVLAQEDGEGGAQPRPTPPDTKRSMLKGKRKYGGDDEIRQQRVTWAPDTGFVPDTLRSSARDDSEEEPAFGGGFRHRNLHEKDERKVKELDAESPQGQRRPPSRPRSSRSSSVDIHKSDSELRPSRDEVDLTEGTWELISKQAEHEADVDASETDQVDGVAFCIAYILALVERYAPEELDNTTDQTYREGRARSHLERLYIIAPFWERLGMWLRKLYRWDNPKRTATAAMIFFVLWWSDLLPTAFFLTLIYYVLQFRFFPPEASYLHEQVRARMARGVEADKLAERLRRRSRLDILEIYRRFTAKYGVEMQLAAGDIADFHEKAKNLLLWRNPQATWRTLTLFGLAAVFVTFVPAYYIWKAFFFFIGFTFFCLFPLQSHYPRYRRPLSPFWWALWGAPTDAQFAIQLLRRRHLERAHMDSVKGGKRGKLRRSEAAHAVKRGAMKPIHEEDEALFGLEEELVAEGPNGERQFKPKKLGSFFCQHHGVPGHLTITTHQIYFRGLGHSKSCKTPLEDIAGLSKTKSLRMLVWYSSGLQIARTNKRSLFFSNMVKRDEAFNLILAVGSDVWSKC